MTIVPYLTTVEGVNLAAQTFDKDVAKLPGAQAALRSVGVQLAGEGLKCGDVVADNGPGAVKAVVIPAPAVANLETCVAAFDAVPGVALAIVGLLGYVHLGADAQ